MYASLVGNVFLVDFLTAFFQKLGCRRPNTVKI